MNFQDLAEHVGALVSLLALFAGISGFLLWRMFTRLEQKLDELAKFCWECRQDLAEQFLTRVEHEAEHQGLWDAIHYHEHQF
ncbi:MAG: hypothetical protein AB1491_10080 [Thermodesulfobacteriota bacterium]